MYELIKLSTCSSRRQLHPACLPEESGTEDAEPNLRVSESLHFMLSVKNVWVLSWLENMSRYFWTSIKVNGTYPPSSYCINLYVTHHYYLFWTIYSGPFPINLVYKLEMDEFKKISINEVTCLTSSFKFPVGSFRTWSRQKSWVSMYL